MSSINHITTFKRRFNNDDGNDDGDDETETPPTIMTAPVQGFHLLHTFEKRMWLEIDHVHSGYTLLQIIFELQLFKLRVFPGSKTKEMVFSFLILITDTCKRRLDFVHVLAQICLFFCNCDLSTAEGRASKTEVIISLIEDRHNFVSAITERASYVNPAETIFAVNDFMTSHSERKTTFNLTGGHTEEFNLNFISYTIFNHWLKFHAQKNLKVVVDGAETTKDGTPTYTTTTQDLRKQPYKKSVDHVQDCLAKLPLMSSQLEFTSPPALSIQSINPTAISMNKSIGCSSGKLPIPILTYYAHLASQHDRWVGCNGVVPKSILYEKVTSSFYIQTFKCLIICMSLSVCCLTFIQRVSWSIKNTGGRLLYQAVKYVLLQLYTFLKLSQSSGTQKGTCCMLLGKGQRS
jgi:hypothetical protein